MIRQPAFESTRAVTAIEDVQPRDDAETLPLGCGNLSCHQTWDVPPGVDVLNPSCIQVDVVDRRLREPTRCGSGDRCHVGPYLLAVPGHLLDGRMRNGLSPPLRSVFRLVDEEVPHQRTIGYVGTEVVLPEPIGQRLPFRQAEGAIGILDLLIGAAVHLQDHAATLGAYALEICHEKLRPNSLHRTVQCRVHARGSHVVHPMRNTGQNTSWIDVGRVTWRRIWRRDQGIRWNQRIRWRQRIG
jgi:hypothetical protein